MGVNPFQLLQALNTNPQQFIKKALGNNPMAGNLVNMISNKDYLTREYWHEGMCLSR